jgi:hypothetical protein
MMDIESDAAGPRYRNRIEKNVRHGRLRNGPKDPGPLGPAGGGGRDILKRDVFPVGGGGRNRRSRVGSRGKVGRIPARQVKGIVQDARHGDVGIGKIAVGSATVPARFPTDAVLGSIEGAVVDEKILDTALGISPDGKPMSGPEGAILDGNPRHRLCSAQLDQVVPVADIAIFNEDVFPPQVDPIRIGGRPGGRNAESRRVNVGPVSQ